MNSLNEMKYLICDMIKDESSGMQKYFSDSGIGNVIFEQDITNVQKQIAASTFDCHG